MMYPAWSQKWHVWKVYIHHTGVSLHTIITYTLILQCLWNILINLYIIRHQNFQEKAKEMKNDTHSLHCIKNRTTTGQPSNSSFFRDKSTNLPNFPRPTAISPKIKEHSSLTRKSPYAQVLLWPDARTSVPFSCCVPHEFRGENFRTWKSGWRKFAGAAGVDASVWVCWRVRRVRGTRRGFGTLPRVRLTRSDARLPANLSIIKIVRHWREGSSIWRDEEH